MIEELKPCPFCGKHPIWKKTGGTDKDYTVSIECPNGHARAVGIQPLYERSPFPPYEDYNCYDEKDRYGKKKYLKDSDIIKSWNHRTP